MQPLDASPNDLGIANMNSKIDFRKVEVDKNADLLSAAHQFLDKEEIKGNLGVILCMALA